MPAYRFYDLGPLEPEEMGQGLFFSDGAAMTWGFRWAGSAGIEVWQGERFVGRLHGAGSVVAAVEPDRDGDEPSA